MLKKIPIQSPSDFQKLVSNALGSEVYHIEKFDRIVFLENYLKLDSKKYRGYRKTQSVQRKLQGSVLKDLSTLLNKKGKILDVAGSKDLCLFLGYNSLNCQSLNLVPDGNEHISYLCDA